jgi:uncharacterized protein (TIGR00159 family)
MNKFSLFLSSIRWQDIVDITLNSYILFRLYVLFRGTNTFRVLVGIALLWFFQRIAVFCGLIITSWAIQAITAVAALIIIVVFRNEIRSVLQARNLKSILWGFSRKIVSTPVEIIVESVFELAQKRIGALIVLPGKNDLEDVVQSGIPWHGSVSKEMIMSIFWHDNPVHDGAAIIQGNQVSEVGVILPLSRRNDIPSYYGTRHKAALGLAESTDALVILVSEERGNVLVARGSEFTVVKQKKKLIQMLREHAGVPTKEVDYLRKERIETSIAALVCLLFVIGIWFSFSRGLETLITLEVPVEYMNRDPGMEILDTSVNTVNIHLSGSGSLIKTIQPEQVKVKLDLDKAVVGSNIFTITNDNISLPPGVSLKKVEPSVVEVTLDVPIEKELPVQVDWAGRLPEHLILTKVNLDPEKIRVIGPNQILKNITTIYTEKVSLDNLKKTGIITANPVLDPASLKIAPGSKEKIVIEYIIKKRKKLSQDLD